jgi:hypothetical protein
MEGLRRMLRSSTQADVGNIHDIWLKLAECAELLQGRGKYTYSHFGSQACSEIVTARYSQLTKPHFLI